MFPILHHFLTEERFGLAEFLDKSVFLYETEIYKVL